MKRLDVNVCGVSAETEKVLRARGAFINQYCTEKGWSKATLTIQQILEIRAQDGWKNPNLEG